MNYEKINEIQEKAKRYDEALAMDVDPIRGYSIEDEDGNRMVEIGFEI